jgi:putative ABC transport system substrate-binding protein
MVTAAIASLLASRIGFAQPAGRVFRVGFLSARRRPASLDSDYYGAFPKRMAELGYVEGRNLAIEWRFADGDYARLPAFAAELVKLNVDAILALGPPGARAAHEATKTIPIVIVVADDPVRAGLVNSLAKPGGNVTGLFNLAADLVPKHFEMLRAVVPNLARVALLVNPANTAHAAIRNNAIAAARQWSIDVLVVEAASAADIARAFEKVSAGRAQAIVIVLDPLFIQQVRDIADRATRRKLPAIFAIREFAEAGGLLSYGWDQSDIYGRAAGYVDRIFKGAKPADLPVQQPTTLELVVNAKSAQALGLTVPASLGATAADVIR